LCDWSQVTKNHDSIHAITAFWSESQKCVNIWGITSSVA